MKKLAFITLLAASIGIGYSLRADGTNGVAGSSKMVIKSTETNCVVSDEKLGEHGKPVTNIYQGREIVFCCKDCIKDFKKDPAKYMAKLDAEKAAAK